MYVFCYALLENMLRKYSGYFIDVVREIDCQMLFFRAFIALIKKYGLKEKQTFGIKLGNCETY